MKGMFSANVEMKSYITAMKIISRDALPDAVAESLNATADAVTKLSKRNVSKLFTVRTNYTLKGVKTLNKARGNKVDRMFSRSGTYSNYLWMHDVKGGFHKEGISGGSIPIATDYARTSKSSMKAIRKKYRIQKSEKFRPGDFGTIDGYGRYFVGTPKGGKRRYGVYERGFRNKRLNMLRNLETKKARLKDTNWHDGAVKKHGTSQFIAAQFKKAAQKRLKRFQ